MPTFPRSSLSLAFILALGGCDILDPIITTGIASETGPSETSTVTTDATTGEPVDSSTVTTADPSGAGFIFPPDPPAPCDVWAQDCPAGEKCSAEGPSPIGPGSIACTAIVPEPAQAGEPCQVLVEDHIGPDTCDFGLYCINIDPVTHQGVCQPLCTGSLDSPVCGSGQVCLTSNDIPLCFEACDPLQATCPDDDVCIPLYTGFACFFDTDPPKGPLEGCEYASQCDDGLFCAIGELAVECDPDWLGCCISFCDLSAPGTCPGVGQQCLPFFPPDVVPPGLEHVGACSLP